MNCAKMLEYIKNGSLDARLAEIYPTADQNAVKDRYNAKVYDDIRLRVPKGQKEQIQAYAEQNGETLNGFINRLIAEAMGVDKTAEGNENL